MLISIPNVLTPEQVKTARQKLEAVEWVDGKVKQRVLLRLGRLDELLASGKLDALSILGALAADESAATRSTRIGPP